jgi:adenylate kinase family enzyme
MKLIIVRGGGATGKSTLAQKLHKVLGIPVFAKDDYKSARYNANDKKPGLSAWKKLEEQSYDATYQAIKSAVKHNKSLLVEGNFTSSHKKEFQDATRGYLSIIEINCYAKSSVQVRRYIERNKNDGNPEGSRDHIRYAVVRIEALCAKLGFGWYKPLNLSDNLFRFDATNLDEIDYQKVIDFIKTTD